MAHSYSKKKNVRQILDLNKKDQIKLMEEIDYCSKVMKKSFKAFNLNVEKIGNIIPQLHIHIIARNKKILRGLFQFGL